MMGYFQLSIGSKREKPNQLPYIIKYVILIYKTTCVSLCCSGTKHKTILEARSGLGPIKAYPRLGPKPIGEQGGGATDPNTQERTFHCEICNVRVNSELQLKQVCVLTFKCTLCFCRPAVTW